jgi:ribosomal protein S18 acetylase RimI-like enzyme
MEFAMIRSITPDDTIAAIALAEATGLFQPHESLALATMLTDHFSGETDSQDLWLTDDDDGLVGIAYVAPERMTEGTWNLYLLAIHPDRQRQGRGAALLARVEQMLVERGERLLLVETSGVESFDYVRAFYRKSGYEQEGRIHEFYAVGIDKIVFRKALSKESAK